MTMWPDLSKRKLSGLMLRRGAQVSNGAPGSWTGVLSVDRTKDAMSLFDGKDHLGHVEARKVLLEHVLMRQMSASKRPAVGQGGAPCR